MKVKRLFTLMALCILTGCGEPINQSLESGEEALAVMAEIPSETAAAPVTSVVTESEAITVPPKEINFSNKTIEVYEKVTVNELFSANGIQLRNGDELIDTDETGEFSRDIAYIYKNNLYRHSVSYTVTDTTPPVLLNSGDGAVVQLGETFDLNDCVGFADNYDSKPVLTYDGFVDTSVCGTYPVSASVTDSSGNVTDWELNITVAEEIPVPEDNNERLPFDVFTEKYSDENVRFGIDVSKWQYDIDFEAVKKAGCSFVIMRIASYYDEITIDEYFERNMAAAKEAGLDVGVYIYTTANSEDEIRENAEWIADKLEGCEIDFPVVFDWEDFGNFQQYNMSINDLNRYFQLFSEEMKKYGYSSMLYSSKNFLCNFWYEQTENPVWLAHYTDETTYTGDYSMWQMSCFGNIDGIDGDVDLNILYTDRFMN